MARRPYAALTRYAASAQGDMSADRRGELVNALETLGYSHADALAMVWQTPLNESDTDEEALRAILAPSAPPSGMTAVSPSGNVLADTTPIEDDAETTGEVVADATASGVTNALNSLATVLLPQPPAAAPATVPLASAPATVRLPSGQIQLPTRPIQRGNVNQQVAQGQQALARIRQSSEDETAETRDAGQALGYLKDRWEAGVQPYFQGVVNWVSSRPTPGGISALLVVLIFFLFVIVPVNGKYTRLQLIWLTLTGHTKLPTPKKPIQAIPNSPIAAGVEALATSTEDIAREIGVMAGDFAGLSSIAGVIGNLGPTTGGQFAPPGDLAASGVAGVGMQSFLNQASGGLLTFSFGEDGYTPLAPDGSNVTLPPTPQIPIPPEPKIPLPK